MRVFLLSLLSVIATEAAPRAPFSTQRTLRILDEQDGTACAGFQNAFANNCTLAEYCATLQAGGASERIEADEGSVTCEGSLDGDWTLELAFNEYCFDSLNSTGYPSLYDPVMDGNKTDIFCSYFTETYYFTTQVLTQLQVNELYTRPAAGLYTEVKKAVACDVATSTRWGGVNYCFPECPVAAVNGQSCLPSCPTCPEMQVTPPPDCSNVDASLDWTCETYLANTDALDFYAPLLDYFVENPYRPNDRSVGVSAESSSEWISSSSSSSWWMALVWGK